MRVSMFIPCLVEELFPEAGEAAALVLVKAGVEPDYPAGQTCCGQMEFKLGHRQETKTFARHFMEVFAGDQPVVSPSASCVAMVRHHYPVLFQDDPVWRERALSLAARTFELSEFLVNELHISDLGASWQGKAAYHNSCQMARALGVVDEPMALLKQVRGLEVVEPDGAELCCGFGGVFSVQFSEVSEKMVAEKARALLDTGADCIVSAEPSCMMNISGYLKKQGSRVPVVHLAQVLAGEGGRP